ncbi:MAG: tetratricopeptide repeat protein, partial [Proteobacteria bacterium]
MKTSIRTQLLIATVAATVVAAPMLAEAKKSKEPGVEEQLKFKAGDESGNEVKALKTEMLVIKSEKQAVAQLDKLLKRYKKTRMEPEILFRFAELYMRRARSERFFEIHKNDKEIVSFVPQLVKDASESAEIKKSIAYYQEIQEKWPRFRAMDVVIFNHAYAYQQLGEDKKAETLLYRLIKEHGSSGLVPDSYLAVGEIAFQRRDFKLALEQFKQIRRFPNARVYPYGIYKTAWTYYNLQDATSGLKQLEDVVAFGHQVALSKQDSKLDLRKEALGDMALYFSDVKKSEEAVKYFQVQAKELDAIPYIMRLVELYNRHSQYKDIESVLKDVLKTWPESPSAAQAHEELAWNYERLKNRAAAGEQLAAFDKWCDALIERTPKSKKGAVVEPECRTKITEASKKLSTKWHAKSNSDKWSDEDEKRFQTLADTYVKRFPTGQYAFDLRFKRAFIAYEKERYDEAAPQFKKIGWTDVASATQASDKILKAQDLYLDILNIKKDYKAIKEAAKLLLGGKQDAGRTTQIEKIYREAYFSEIQQMEEKGEIAQAVEAYKKFALENTGSELAPKAWWNASQLQFRMGDAQGGANTCYQMHKLFPKSSNGRDCLTKAAQTFETMARLDLAARVLLNLALVEADKQDKWREVAADFFALSGDKERAITMYQKLAEDRKKQSEQVALLDKAAILARDSGDMKTVAAIEAKFSREGIEPQASRLVVEQAEEALAKQDYSKAFNVSKRIIGKGSLPKELLARARFVQAQVLEDEYRRQSVKARVEKVGMVLAMKTEKLEKAQKAFQSAINYGDPATSVKSLKRLANCYLDYAAQVRGMDLKGVSEADLQAFRGETEQLVVPMEEKGIESMNQALDAAKKAQLREGQIAEIQMEVNKLNMKSEVLP